MMARRFEGGFHLVERCKRELPALAALFPPGSAMRTTLEEMAAAAVTADDLLRKAGEPGRGPGAIARGTADRA